MFVITKTFTFAAAHHLTCVPEGHKCSRLHGHTYTVTVEMAAEQVDAAGMVRDYGELGALDDYLQTDLDHRVLNDRLGFEPTAELIAYYLHDWCARRWPETRAVRVTESPTSSAEYRAVAMPLPATAPGLTLDRVAVIYRDHAYPGGKPVEAVAKALGCSRSTASRRIKAAEHADLLPPTTKGKKRAGRQ